jgi:pyridoxine 5-phosphate synthase
MDLATQKDVSIAKLAVSKTMNRPMSIETFPTRLSVNVNKIATLRNARGGNLPCPIRAAQHLQAWGADGITVHPRPDARHITYEDVRKLRPVVHTEFNIEGYPTEDFVELVLEVQPEQVTLVPDPPDVLTSNAGWDTLSKGPFLRAVLGRFQSAGIRTSLFIETDTERIRAAADLGADRIELYTESYAVAHAQGDPDAAAPFLKAALTGKSVGLGINAGHFAQVVQHLDEVSIGHALISDALYLGLQNAVGQYKEALRPKD